MTRNDYCEEIDTHLRFAMRRNDENCSINASFLLRPEAVDMDRQTFAISLKRAIFESYADFRGMLPGETPYALAVILGQSGKRLGIAIATEEGLIRVTEQYAARGYRYRGPQWQEYDNLERLYSWLRWANPDDGWYSGGFGSSHELSDSLSVLLRAGEFATVPEDIEELSMEVLICLRADQAWAEITNGASVILGVTSGEDPRDFLRTATLANDYAAVRRLWSEFWLGEELSTWMTT